MRERGLRDNDTALANATVENLHKLTYMPSDVAAATFRQNYKGFGYRYGLEVLAGVDESERLGIDPLVMKERMRASSASQDLRMSILSSLEDLQDDIISGNAIPGIDASAAKANLGKLQSEIGRLKSLTPDEFKDAMSLKEGTAAFERYAATSVQRNLALQEEASVRSASSSMRSARSSTDVVSAPVEARRVADALIESQGISDLMNRLNAFKASDSEVNNLMRDLHEGEIGKRLSDGLMAIKENYQSQGRKCARCG